MSDRVVAMAAGRTLRVLTYHRVRSLEAGPAAAGLPSVERGVDRDVFDRQMQLLKAGFTPVDLDLVNAWLRSEAELPWHAALVTFDDGYRDLYDYAFPVLQKYGIPATIFLPTGYAGTSKLFWWDTLAFSLRKLDRPLDDQRWIDTECPSTVARALRRIPLAQGMQKTIAIESVANGLKTLAPDPLMELVARLSDLAGNPSPDPQDYALLSWDQVREMAGKGVSFGAHTVNHVILTRVDHSVAEREIRESRLRIEEELGRPISSFCYPSGAHSDDVKRIVSSCGFSIAFTTVVGCNGHGADALALRRISIANSSGPDFESRLFDSYHLLRRLLRRG